MVQQIAIQSLSVLPLQVVAEPDFDLAPDLLAATDYMSPTAAPPSAAVPPATSVDVDFGDLTLSEITSFLPPGSERPLELDTPWSTPTSIPPVEESSTTSAVTDVLLALANDSLFSEAPVSSSLADVISSPAAPSPLVAPSLRDAPSSPTSLVTPAATSTSVRSSGVASPARAAEESDDDDLDEYGDPNDPYSAAPIDLGAVYPIRKLIDRVVNAWKAFGSDLSFNAFDGSNFRGAGANEKNVGDHWERFCRVQGNEIPKGVLAKDIDAFFNFVRSDGVRLDYVELFKKCLKVSVTSLQVLDRDDRHLPPGYYVHAAEDLVEHCFALALHGPEDPVEVFDDYQEGKDPSCKPEPLRHLEWITKVYALYRVALPKPKSKRSKKP
ncbi:Hypothetical protein PHPALM_16897 [Phytophthora palmivora]|uniref:Uncharacterized protein n=1 Tax=Phytophthora palmivora TaxID=4796 RepID=A0A2P4XNL8_9STRA|nr:Hypothetical protein PHPALM_16897 [Phytophthora palmivora]